MKVLVCHPMQQHSFYLASALLKADCDVYYLTSVYDKKYSLLWFFKRLFKHSLNSKVDSKRHIAIKMENVYLSSQFLGAFFLLCIRFRILHKLAFFVNLKLRSSFDKNAFQLIKKIDPDVIISFDTYCGNLFKRLSDEGSRVTKVVDMSAAYARFVDDIECEFGLVNLSNTYYLKKKQFLTKVSDLELLYADRFLVASNFSEKSLIQYGISNAVIHICRYGLPGFLDRTKESPIPLENFNVDQINLLYLGRVSDMKGCSYLLNVMSKLGNASISLHLIGSIDHLGSIRTIPPNCHYHGVMDRNRIMQLLPSFDALVVPSFSDGFGFVVLEALFSKIPVICSKNVGSADFIENARNGFVFDAGDEDKLFEIISNLDRRSIDVLKENIILQQEPNLFSWNEYNLAIKEFISEAGYD